MKLIHLIGLIFIGAIVIAAIGIANAPVDDDTGIDPPNETSIGNFAWSKIYNEFIEWRTEEYKTDLTAQYALEKRYSSGDLTVWDEETGVGRASANCTMYFHDYRSNISEFYIVDIFFNITWDPVKEKYMMEETSRSHDHW